MSNVQPVFVVGSARSGTTMIDRLLSSAESFQEYRAETQLMSVCRKRYGDIFTRKKNRQSFLDDWFRSNQFARSNLTQDEFLAILDTSFSYAELLVNFLTQMALKGKKEFIVDSTPANLEHINVIAKECKSAKFVWIIRDGRDVSLSQVKLGWVNPPFPFTSKEDKLNYALINWTFSNKLSINNSAANIYIIKYEEFVKQPQKELKKLAKFLNLSESIFNLAEITEQKQTNTAYGKIESSDKSIYLARWKAENETLIKNFTVGCTKAISNMGYIVNNETKTIRSFIRFLYFSLHIKTKRILNKNFYFSKITSEKLVESKLKSVNLKERNL